MAGAVAGAGEQRDTGRELVVTVNFDVVQARVVPVLALPLVAQRVATAGGGKLGVLDDMARVGELVVGAGVVGVEVGGNNGLDIGGLQSEPGEGRDDMLLRLDREWPLGLVDEVARQAGVDKDGP